MHGKPRSSHQDPKSSDNGNQKSPIFSPDLESGICLKFSFGKPPTIYRFFALPSKPGLCFDPPESPEIATRQKIFSTRGGVLATASRDAREALSNPSESKSRGLWNQNRFPLGTS